MTDTSQTVPGTAKATRVEGSVPALPPPDPQVTFDYFRQDWLEKIAPRAPGMSAWYRGCNPPSTRQGPYQVVTSVKGFDTGPQESHTADCLHYSYQWWNGTFWGSSASTSEGAFHCRHMPSVFQTPTWRGSDSAPPVYIG